jgi:multidrug transporter EmrE-like cation transporter
MHEIADPMNSLLIIVTATLLGVLGDVALKLAGERAEVHFGWLSLGTLAYVLTVPCWFFAMRSTPLSIVGGLYAVVTVLMLAFIGIVWFHEQLRPIELVGLLMAFSAALAFRRLLA